MNRLTEALIEVCREHLLTEKWLIAPSRRIGAQWLQQLAWARQGIINVHVTTINKTAFELAAPELARTGQSRIAKGFGVLIIDAILGQLRADRLVYLGRLRPSIGLSEAVYRSILDLRLAGVGAAQLCSGTFEVGDKGKDLATVMTAYVDHLQTNNLVDYADVLRLARRRLQDDPCVVDTDRLLLVPDDAHCHVLEQALLDAWPPDRLIRLPIDEPIGDGSKPVPVRMDVDVLRWLLEPPLAPPPLRDGTVQMFRAVGEANEVREVLRRCVAGNIPLDHVEVLHTDGATYVPLIYETLEALSPVRTEPDKDLPLTLVEGLPCRYSRPGRALTRWVAWVREGYAQQALVDMVRDGLLTIPGQDDPNFAALAALLRSVGIGFGCERYLPKLDRQVAGLERQIEKLAGATDEDGESLAYRIESRRRKLRDFRALRKLVSHLLELASARRQADPKQVLDDAIRFLDAVARRVSKLDNYAHERLVLDIKELRHCLEQSGEPMAFDVWEWLSALPAVAQILGSGPRQGCLHVAPVSSGGHSGRPHTFIIGLDDGRFPGAGFQDPLLLDGERRGLSKELATSAGRLEETLRGFTRLLARLRGRLTLSYSCRNLIEDRDMFPSPVLLAAYRIISGNRQGDQTTFLSEWLPRPASFAPDEPERCLDESEWWMWRLCGPEMVANAPQLVGQCFAHIERGWEARRQRDSDVFTIYDGLVEQAGADLDPTVLDDSRARIMSARKLETAGRCPLAYFFEHALEIEQPQELRIDRSRWLDPMTSGRLSHEVFERFLRELIENNERPLYDRDFPRLHEILRESVEMYREAYPPPADSVFEEQCRQLQQSIHVFLKVEEEFCARRQCWPTYLEAAIGIARENRSTPLDSNTPVSISLPGGGHIRACGKVDRIDRLGGGAVHTYAIWDYKGSAYKYDAAEPFRQGRVIQPYLYLSMVGHRIREAVSSDASIAFFGFFFPGVRDRGLRIEWTPDVLQAGGPILENICDIIRRGAFLATDNADEDCKFCGYQRVCGDVRAVAAASRRKLDYATNTVLQPFLKLRPHAPKQKLAGEQ